MSETVMNAARMMNLLPAEEQEFACEFIKRLLRAWDPDYTKLTADEETALQAAEESGFLSESEIDWDHLDRIA